MTLVSEFKADGYEVGVGNDIDGTICAESDCPNCGRNGMTYTALRKQGSYIAVAGCPNCGHEMEF